MLAQQQQSGVSEAMEPPSHAGTVAKSFGLIMAKCAVTGPGLGQFRLAVCVGGTNIRLRRKRRCCSASYPQAHTVQIIKKACRAWVGEDASWRGLAPCEAMMQRRSKGAPVKTPRSVARTPLTTVTAAAVVSTTLTVETGGVGFVDLTGEIEGFVEDAGGLEGFALLFCRHTSASLTIQENADPSVLDDLITALNRLAPTDAGWTHRTEGPDDMPAHVKTMLTTTALQIPVTNGKLALGVWQAIYLIEHRTRPHRREIMAQFIGTKR
jgi:secondary thiamine-phosphate synthase enzyme